MQIDIDEKREELFNNYYFANNSEKYDSLSNKKFRFFEKVTKNKFKFSIKKKIIYLQIFGFVIILGLILFFISQSKKNELTITNKSLLLEKRF